MKRRAGWATVWFLPKLSLRRTDPDRVSSPTVGIGSTVTEKDLRLLGLKQWPVEPERVRSSFRSRLKQVHPDRNPRLRDWAARRTGELILAAERALREAEAIAGIAGEATGDRLPWAEHWALDRLSVQLLRTPAGSFALPIESLVAVVLPADILRTGLFGPYAAFDGSMFEVRTLDGSPVRPDRCAAVFVFGQAPGGARFAIALGQRVRTLRIVTVSAQELVWVGGTATFAWGEETFVIPSQFFQPDATEKG